MAKRISAILVALALLLGPLSVSAGSGKNVLGWVEKVTIEPWGVEVKAKLDTGALTSSMHAENINRFEQGGEEWVRFTVDVEDEDTGERRQKDFVRPVYRNIRLRGAGGEERRAVVLMKLCVGDTIHEEQFSLTDRSDMIYPVLVGRRTLQHLGVVDVTETFRNSPHCDNESQTLDNDQQSEDVDIDDDAPANGDSDDNDED